MSKVLRRAPLADRSHPVAPPEPGMHVDSGVYAEIFERGRAAGFREGAAAARAQSAALVDAIRSAFADGVAAMRAHHAEAADELLELAVRLARHAAVESDQSLVERIRQALESIDDVAPVVAVDPAFADVVSVALGADVVVRPDPSIAPGGAVVAGAWSRTDLTVDGTWEAIRAALGLT